MKNLSFTQSTDLFFNYPVSFGLSLIDQFPKQETWKLFLVLLYFDLFILFPTKPYTFFFRMTLGITFSFLFLVPSFVLPYTFIVFSVS